MKELFPEMVDRFSSPSAVQVALLSLVCLAVVVSLVGNPLRRLTIEQLSNIVLILIPLVLGKLVGSERDLPLISLAILLRLIYDHPPKNWFTYLSFIWELYKAGPAFVLGVAYFGSFPIVVLATLKSLLPAILHVYQKFAYEFFRGSFEMFMFLVEAHVEIASNVANIFHVGTFCLLSIVSYEKVCALTVLMFVSPLIEMIFKRIKG